MDNYIDGIFQHYSNVWGNIPTAHVWNRGPIGDLPQGFKILRFEPIESRSMWTYATCGMSIPYDNSPLELHIFSPSQNDSLIELLTAISHYHRTGSKLDIGHTTYFGQPWFPNSNCEYGLISPPYIDGPLLELAEINGKNTRFLWLIPITKQEVDFKKQWGLEELEKKIDSLSLDYINPHRKSLILTTYITCN